MAEAIRGIQSGVLASFERAMKIDSIDVANRSSGASRIAGATSTAASSAASEAAGVTGVSGGKSFSDILTNAVGEARGNEAVANDMANRFAAGDPDIGIHETMIAAEKASISLRFAVTLKNRVLEAYRELMNTSV